MAFIRSTLSETVATPHDDNQALSTLFFLNRSFAPATRLLLAALCFALGACLVLPWRRESRRALIFLSIIPFALWIWLLSSVFTEHNSENDGIVMQEVPLRTADSNGASSLLPYPLPPGTEPTIVESRQHWSQVSLANGQQGWIPASSFEKVMK